jgi:glutamate carboxypeptidase
MTENTLNFLVGPLRGSVSAFTPDLLRMLGELVRIESPSDDPAAVNRAVAWVEAAVLALGGRPVRHRAPGYGDLLEARFGPRASPGESILLLGHLDTVWPVGTLARMPFREEDGRVFGPGVLDMKAGVVMALTAMRALADIERLPPVILLLNSDEEVGSVASRPLTERLAGECRAVFVLEPAQGPQGAYKTARKGIADYRLEVHGVAAHSGVDFTAGHSAVLELARQIERIGAFTDLDRGLTLNPGIVGGGSRANVVAAEAWAEIDVRLPAAKDAPEIDRRLRSLSPFDPACRITITGGMNRPPMERTEAGAALFQRAREIARRLGFALEEAATGGGSDGNFTAALGVPTLDGMGAVGQGAHAEHESILGDCLLPRTTLLAAMLASAVAPSAAHPVP